jgi:glycosyltransferase involved in cell wall biosynthesis
MGVDRYARLARMSPGVDGRLRVAVDATPLLGTPTGVGVFCREALTALAQLGEVEVSAFAISWRRRHLLGRQLPEGVRLVGRAMPARPLQMTWRHSNFPDLSWFVGDTEVVHGTNFVVPPARRAARIVTVHDLTIVRYPEMCEPETLRFPALVRRAVAEGAWVHTPSQFVADEVVDTFAVDPDRVRAVHHGAPLHIQGDRPLQGDRPRQPREDAGSPGGIRRGSPGGLRRGSPGGLRRGVPGGLPEGTSRYVLAIGTAEPRKDLPGLVRAFDAIAGGLDDVALVMVGQPGWGSEALEGAIAESKFGSRIVRAGYVDDLGEVLAGAEVLAYPSLYEGFGLPTLEAMSVGVPVVTTTAGALPEVVGDAAEVVAPGDTDELAGALERVLTDEGLRTGLSERGLRRASLFTWEDCARGLSALYRDAASSQK